MELSAAKKLFRKGKIGFGDEKKGCIFAAAKRESAVALSGAGVH